MMSRMDSTCAIVWDVVKYVVGAVTTFVAIFQLNQMVFNALFFQSDADASNPLEYSTKIISWFFTSIILLGLGALVWKIRSNYLKRIAESRKLRKNEDLEIGRLQDEQDFRNETRMIRQNEEIGRSRFFEIVTETFKNRGISVSPAQMADVKIIAKDIGDKLGSKIEKGTKSIVGKIDELIKIEKRVLKTNQKKSQNQFSGIRKTTTRRARRYVAAN